MKIVYAIHAALEQDERGPTSVLASARYRVLIPARYLASVGHEIQVVTVGNTPWTTAELDKISGDAIIVSKSFLDTTAELVRHMKAQGARVIVDASADQFGHPQYGALFERLLAMGDQIVANTEKMREILKTRGGRDCIVISDPVEGPRATPKLSPRLPDIRMVCFGNPNSLQVLASRWQDALQLSQTMPVRLAIVTSAIPQVQDLVATINRASPRLRAMFAPWALKTVWSFLKECDVLWIPAQGSEAEAIRSPNRLIEGIWAGRLVVADQIPSYMPFVPYARIGSGLVDGVVSALSEPARIEQAIGEGQELVATNHSPEAIGRQWAAAIGPVAG